MLNSANTGAKNRQKQILTLQAWHSRIKFNVECARITVIAENFAIFQPIAVLKMALLKSRFLVQ
jgi:hypothetical protein